MVFVKLNVGGMIFETTKETLVSRSEYFRSMFERWDTSKSIQIDTCPIAFQHILAFCRDINYKVPYKYTYYLDYFGISYCEHNIKKDRIEQLKNDVNEEMKLMRYEINNNMKIISYNIQQLNYDVNNQIKIIEYAIDKIKIANSILDLNDVQKMVKNERCKNDLLCTDFNCFASKDDINCCDKCIYHCSLR